MNDLKSKIIEYAKNQGADLVGFSDIKRFSNSPYENNPLRIFPQAKSVIGLGFRILRGSTRGIEEGSTFYQYTTMAIENIEENVMPMTMLRLSAFIEDLGYEAIPQRSYPLIMSEENSTNPEVKHDNIFRGIKHEVQMDFKYSAIACGFGEIGLSGQVLTKEYGPYQRFCYILTNAEIEADPIKVKELCDDCKECINACPGKAFKDEEKNVSVCENEYKIQEIEPWQCAVYYNGALKEKNPFMPDSAYENIKEREAIMNGEIKLSPDLARKVLDESTFYPSCRHSLISSICGRACDRACYVHLEKQDKLAKKFKSNYRKRKEWKLEG